MKFSKMHGLGNDFMIVNAVTKNIFFSKKLIRQLSNRYTGIGFDQLILVEPPKDPNIDFHYRIFNSNGSEAEQCGNGARCFALFVYLKKLTNKRDIHVSTINRRMVLNITDNKMIRVNMGEPNFNFSQILSQPENSRKTYKIQSDKKIAFYKCNKQIALCNIVSIGNPHCVIQVKNVKTAAVKILGSILENHECFLNRVNVNFMQIVKRERIFLRVYERGIGETKACGSGACAAVAVGIMNGLLSEKVCVDLPGGRLDIIWKGPGYPLYMIGPATHIYDGFFYL